MMFVGQALLLTDFSLAYFFYGISFVIAIALSVLFWMASNSNFSNGPYLVIVGLLVGVPFAIHWETRKRAGAVPLIPIYSIFFLGLLIILSTSGIVSTSLVKTSLSAIFNVAIIIFVITSIFGLNISWRTLVLNKALKISNRKRYLEIIKEELKKRYTSKEALKDIDLLTYYLSSSLDAFVNGDFDRSYIDAFKVIDDYGKAFKRIYPIGVGESELGRLSNIRNNLSHAKIKGTENMEQTQALKEVKKDLFKDTLGLLKLIKFEFIEKALEPINDSVSRKEANPAKES